MDRREDDERPERRLSDLIAAGLVLPPCTAVPAPSPVPLPSTGGPSSTEILRRHRRQAAAARAMGIDVIGEGLEEV